MAQVHHPKCKVCQLPINERIALDRELLRGTPITALSQQHGISRDSLYRHKNAHIGPAAALGQRRIAENHGQALLQDMQDIMKTSKEILESAMADGARALSLKAIKEIRNNIETLGKVIFSMKETASGLDPEELEEFRRWHAKKDNWRAGYEELSEEDKSVIRDIIIHRLSQMDSVSEAEDFRSKSYYCQEYGPDPSEFDSLVS